MTRLSFAQCSVVIFGVLTASLSLAENIVQGEAFDLESGALLYTEEHQYQGEFGHKVIYRESNGETFAVKSLNYQPSFTAPAFEQNNFRQGELIKVIDQNDDRFLLEYQKNAKAKLKQGELAITPNLVIDAGFDNLVRQQWSYLTSGETLVFPYLLPTRLRPVNLSIRSIDCSFTSATETTKPLKKVCFKIAPKQWLIKQLTSPLLLTYSTESRQLLEFVGRSNIADKNGRYQDVRITYRYP